MLKWMCVDSVLFREQESKIRGLQETFNRVKIERPSCYQDILENEEMVQKMLDNALQLIDRECAREKSSNFQSPLVPQPPSDYK